MLNELNFTHGLEATALGLGFLLSLFVGIGKDGHAHGADGAF